MRTTARMAIAAFLLVGIVTLARADDPPDVTHDGLRRVPDAKVKLAYAKPDVDFSGYGRIVLDPVSVAFRKRWKSDHPRASNSDMDRIRRRVSELFLETFEGVLEDGGYPIVTSAGEDVLRVRGTILDLDVTAPDVGVGRQRTYAASAGAATLVLELYDSETGEILARAVDRKKARDSAYSIRMAGSSVNNVAEARNVFRLWATLLKERLDAFRAPAAAPTPGR